MAGGSHVGSRCQLLCSPCVYHEGFSRPGLSTSFLCQGHESTVSLFSGIDEISESRLSSHQWRNPPLLCGCLVYSRVGVDGQKYHAGLRQWDGYWHRIRWIMRYFLWIFCLHFAPMVENWPAVRLCMKTRNIWVGRRWGH